MELEMRLETGGRYEFVRITKELVIVRTRGKLSPGKQRRHKYKACN